MAATAEERAVCDAVRRAERGARFLDRKKPDWYRCVSKETQFNVNDNAYCAIGQCFGDYRTGLMTLGISGWCEEKLVQHGFEPRTMSRRMIERRIKPRPVSRLEIERLNTAWRQEILRRLNTKHHDGGEHHVAA